jgi:hypothetical protein
MAEKTNIQKTREIFGSDLIPKYLDPADPAQSAPSAEMFLVALFGPQAATMPDYGASIVVELLDRYAALRTAQLEKRILDLEKFLRGVQEYDCPKQCDQKQNHHTAFCTNARALLTVAAQTPEEKDGKV